MYVDSTEAEGILSCLQMNIMSCAIEELSGQTSQISLIVARQLTSRDSS